MPDGLTPEAGRRASQPWRRAPAQHATTGRRRRRGSPREAVEAMRAEGLLGAWIDPSLGGLGVSIEQIAWACGEIGQRCASSAMVFAMHQIQVASLVRHAGDSGLVDALACARSPRRSGSSRPATSEIGVGGDLRSSKCAVQLDGDGRHAHEAGAGDLVRPRGGRHPRDGAPRRRRAAGRPGARAAATRPSTRSRRRRAGKRSACAARAATASR